MNKEVKKIAILGTTFILLILLVGLSTSKISEHATGEGTTRSSGYRTEIISTTESTRERFAKEDKLIVPQGKEDEYFSDEITIPRNLQVGEDGTITVIESIAINGELLDYEKEERIKQKNESMRVTGVELIDLYENEDNSWTLIYDADNFEKNYQYLEWLFNRQAHGAFNKISVSKDFKEIIIHLNDDATVFGIGMDIMAIKWCSVAAQIYSGTAYNEWNVHIIVVYEETGEQLYEFNFTEADYEYHLTEEELREKLEQAKQNAETNQKE